MKPITELPATGSALQCPTCSYVFLDVAAFDDHQTETGYRKGARGTVTCKDPRKVRTLALTDRGIWRKGKA